MNVARFDTKGGTLLLALSLLAGQISCDGDSGTGPGSLTGRIEIATSTSGANLDPDGFTVTVDGAQNQSIGSNGAAAFSGVAAGDHDVELTGVSANCTVEGDNPRSVTVSGGGVTATAFEITCAPTGAIEVTVSTTGVDLDPDGYLVTVNGSRSQSIGVNASVTFTEVTAAEQTVELTGLAPNCSVGGGNPRSLTVPAGETARTAFAVTCTGTTGSISVTTSTTGVNPDPDGYTVVISRVGGSPIGANATVVIPGLGPGEYEVTLSGLASNCQWAPTVGAVMLATVSVGATTPVTFAVTCFSAPLGTLRVRASTTGPPPFFIYFVGIDGQEEGAVSVNGTAEFQLSAEAHRVSLDVGPTCSVADNGRTVQVVSGTTVETAFSVTC
jgi:hypothetical protein